MDALIEIARMTFLDCGCDQDAPAAALLSGEVCRAARSARFDCLQRKYPDAGRPPHIGWYSCSSLLIWRDS